jgi:hypothetical protein
VASYLVVTNLVITDLDFTNLVITDLVFTNLVFSNPVVSCAPNCVVSFLGPQLFVRTVAPVAEVRPAITDMVITDMPR